MNSLLFLETDDFYVTNGTKGTILCNKIKRLSLIMFYVTECQYYGQYIPIFKVLPTYLNGCHFGIINLSQNFGVVEMSRKTVLPITAVPLILLFVDGKPYWQYSGSANIDEISNFVIQMSQEIDKRYSTMGSTNSRIPQHTNYTIKNPDHPVPAYCLGMPLYGDEEESYLTFIET